LQGLFTGSTKNSSYFKYKKKSFPIIKIDYEDLVTEKEANIKKVLKFLNLGWENSVLEHEKFSHVETDQSGITVGNNNTKIPINVDSVNRYKKFLSKNEISEILDVTSDLMAKLGYNAS